MVNTDWIPEVSVVTIPTGTEMVEIRKKQEAMCLVFYFISVTLVLGRFIISYEVYR